VSPAIYLLFLLAILFAAVVTGAMSRFRRRRKLRICARKWNMHFAPGDRLRLARRIAEQFPVIGAANISVRDLLFRTEESRHQYLFTVDYTVGIIRGKVGRSTVAGFSEPVSRGSRCFQWRRQTSLAPQPMSTSLRSWVIPKPRDGHHAVF
jgi:hypothetical protein